MTIKLALMALLTSLFLQFSLAAVQSKTMEADKILGIYWSPKKDAKIEIYKKGAFYYGKSIWVASPRKDTKNPNLVLQKRDILGIELLSNFKYNDGEYTNGSIYDPESGQTYTCKMSLHGNQLKVRGYIGIPLFGRTEIFEKLASK